MEASEKELRNVQQQLREALARIQQLEVITQNSTEEMNRIKSAYAIKEKHFNVRIQYSSHPSYMVVLSVERIEKERA